MRQPFNAMPPLLDLPTEIIQMIFFELCSPETIFPLHTGEPRLVVTHVYSQWRAIALSTPALWRSFCVCIQDFYPAPQSGPIRTWISRTAQSALSIEFRHLTVFFETSPLIADLVFPVIHRCSFLNLHLNIATLNQLLTLPPNSLHALRSIVTHVKDNAEVDDPTPFATAFQSCPELHTFSLTTFGHPERHPENLKIVNFNVPWQQLTDLRLCSPSIPAYECLDIVRRCTSLQGCCVSMSPVDDFALQRIVELSCHPVVLASLNTFCIKFPDSGNNFVEFLRALRLPHLQNFQPHLWTLAPPPWLLSVLQSVLCDTVQVLDLSEFPFPENPSEALAQAPNLNTLWLNDDCYLYPGMMRALGEGTIAPWLTTLHLCSVENPNLLFDILEARVAAARTNRGIAAFTNVTTLDGCDEPIDEARLLALTDTGMQIEFGCA